MSHLDVLQVRESLREQGGWTSWPPEVPANHNQLGPVTPVLWDRISARTLPGREWPQKTQRGLSTEKENTGEKMFDYKPRNIFSSRTTFSGEAVPGYKSDITKLFPLVLPSEACTLRRRGAPHRQQSPGQGGGCSASSQSRGEALRQWFSRQKRAHPVPLVALHYNMNPSRPCHPGVILVTSCRCCNWIKFLEAAKKKKIKRYFNGGRKR